MRPAVPGAGRPQGLAGPGFLGQGCSAGLGSMAGSTGSSSCRRAVAPSSGAAHRRSPRADLAGEETHGGGKGRGEGQTRYRRKEPTAHISWCLASSTGDVGVQSWAEMPGSGHSQAGGVSGWEGEDCLSPPVSGTRTRSVPSRRGFPSCLQPQEAAGGSPKAGRRRFSGPAW